MRRVDQNKPNERIYHWETEGKVRGLPVHFCLPTTNPTNQMCIRK